MVIQWYGTASMAYSGDAGRFLVDPFVPLPGSRHQVDISAYDGFSAILVTHGHVDHIVNIPEIVHRNPDLTVYCTRTPYDTLRKKGVSERNLQSISYGDRLLINGFAVTVYHGKHAVLPKVTFKVIASILRAGNSRNLPFLLRENRKCVENDETVVFLIEAEGQRILHMGSLNLREDTGYPTDCDLLMLPYNGWEDNLPPAEKIITRLRPKKVILHHFDNTFLPITSDLNLDPIVKRFGDLIWIPDYCVNCHEPRSFRAEE